MPTRRSRAGLCNAIVYNLILYTILYYNILSYHSIYHYIICYNMILHNICRWKTGELGLSVLGSLASSERQESLQRHREPSFQRRNTNPQWFCKLSCVAFQCRSEGPQCFASASCLSTRRARAGFVGRTRAVDGPRSRRSRSRHGSAAPQKLRRLAVLGVEMAFTRILHVYGLDSIGVFFLSRGEIHPNILATPRQVWTICETWVPPMAVRPS